MALQTAYSPEDVRRARQARAEAIAAAGGLEAALATGTLPRFIETTLAEVIVLGLLRQGVRTFLGVLGHGSTEIGEVLRLYAGAGLLRVYGLRSEVEASHAAAALRWVTGQKAAVITSIGPGALQALAAALVPASDGLGVWYLFGDETTEDEGPNMQQIPGTEQHAFLRLCSTMGPAYNLHTPLAVATALRRGLNAVDHPYRAGPFFLLLPMNTQAAVLERFNLDELPVGAPPTLGPAVADYSAIAGRLLAADRVVVKVGGGGRYLGPDLAHFLELVDGVAVLTPIATGALPYHHPRNMLVGGSKGTMPGNYAMENADLLVAIGTRAVCQSDCSRTGYPNVRHVVNVNADVDAATHYGRTTALTGDAALTLQRLNHALRALRPTSARAGASNGSPATQRSPWLQACTGQRQAWQAFKAERYATATLYDETWGRAVLTQPAAIKAATDWARANDVVTFFDAGDVQANGFQIVEDDKPGRTFTETGASYMGFAVSALLATAVSDEPFYGLAISGDGSFTMNPQILIDGVEHGARGCILLLDNRRMGAISGLQQDQYQAVFATNDSVAVDYAAWARAIHGVRGVGGLDTIEALQRALDEARAYPGLTLLHVPVYYGPDALGGLGVYGRWNVGNWCEPTQALRHEIGL